MLRPKSTPTNATAARTASAGVATRSCKHARPRLDGSGGGDDFKEEVPEQAVEADGEQQLQQQRADAGNGMMAWGFDEEADAAAAATGAGPEKITIEVEKDTCNLFTACTNGGVADVTAVCLAYRLQVRQAQYWRC